MTLVEFPDSSRFQFAAQLVAPHALPNTASGPWGARSLRDHLAMTIDDAVVGQLLKRIAEGRPVIMPYATTNSGQPRRWLAAAASDYELVRMLTHIGRLLVPTYALFANGGANAHIQRFRSDPKAHELQRLGARVYPAGYFSLTAPEQFTDTILRRLQLWMDLEERQRAVVHQRQPTYRSLLDTFQAALAARNWPEADAALGELRQRGLTSADNLSFLEIQSLAQQERWSAIWQRDDYADLAKLRMPTAVRGALLTAFHHSVLLSLEQKAHWDDALAAYRQSRERLGLLLAGRFGIEQSPVLRVFAYQCVLEGDQAALSTLRALDGAEDSPALYGHLSGLIAGAPTLAGSELEQSGSSATVAPSVATQRPLTALQRARQALFDGDFDTVLETVDEVDDGEQRAMLLIEVASYSGDVGVATSALLSFWGLAVERQEALRRDNAFLNPKLRILEGIVEPDAPRELELTAPQVDIYTWTDWFERAQDPKHHDTDLHQSLDRLVASASDGFYASSELHELNARLQEILMAPSVMQSGVVNTGLRKLTDVALSDPTFPREDDECAELYEALYAALFVGAKVNETHSRQLLRLAEARLRRSPGCVSSILKDVERWFSNPIPALEDQLLDAFDLLSEYGVQGGLLTDLCRTWVDAALKAPKGRDRISLESWLAFMDWIQPGADILMRLQEALARFDDQAAEDPIALLPAGYRIGIFTLRPSSAERARQQLVKRNSKLDIRICIEQDLNGPAKAIAEHSDLVVVVTTCISHALTYGIGPSLKGKEPVYPASSGFTSMMRAIEERLRATPA